MKTGAHKIVLMIRDRRWLYACWEVAAEKKEKIIQEIGEQGWKNGVLLLRLYDVTNILFNGFNANAYYDIEVNEYTDHWYIRGPSPDRNYLVDLLLQSPDGRTFVIARSNTIKIPVGDALDKIYDNETDFEAIFRLSSGNELPAVLTASKERSAPRLGPECWEQKRMILCNYCTYCLRRKEGNPEAAAMRCWEFKAKYPSEISSPLTCSECDYCHTYSGEEK